MPKASLSIVVPLLNEEDIILSFAASLHKRLSTFGQTHDIEVILSDCGSGDGTPDAVDQVCSRYGWKGIKGQISPPSVGRAVDQGLHESSKDYILVLPCDCMLSSNGIMNLLTILSTEPSTTWGGFAKTYIPGGPLLSVYESLQNFWLGWVFRSMVWTNCLFFKKELWDKNCCNGFMEDVFFASHLKKTSTGRWLNDAVLVSSRRYQRKPLQRILLNGWIYFIFKLGYRNTKNLKRLYLRLK